MQYKIIEFEESYRASLSKLYLDVRQKTFTWLSFESFKLEDFDRDTLDEYILLAQSNNEVLGFISLWIPENFVHHLYIDEKAQKKGIGKQLILTALEKFGYPLTLKCQKRNLNALHFYQKNNWVIKSEGGELEEAYYLMELSNKPL